MVTKTIYPPSQFQKLVMNKWLWMIFCGFFFAYPIYRAFNRELPPESPIISQVEPFEMISDQKEAITNKSLEGKAYIAHFTCLECDESRDFYESIQKIQKRVKGLTTSVAIISFSTKPKQDSVEKIFAKGRELHNNPFVWKLVTSQKMNKEMMNAFQKRSFPMIAKGEADFALVDGLGNIRGYYKNSKISTDQMMIDLGLIINRSKLNFKKLQQ